jgi:hypothetical protein
MYIQNISKNYYTLSKDGNNFLKPLETKKVDDELGKKLKIY